MDAQLAWPSYRLEYYGPFAYSSLLIDMNDTISFRSKEIASSSSKSSSMSSVMLDQSMGSCFVGSADLDVLSELKLGGPTLHLCL